MIAVKCMPMGLLGVSTEQVVLAMQTVAERFDRGSLLWSKGMAANLLSTSNLDAGVGRGARTRRRCKGLSSLAMSTSLSHQPRSVFWNWCTGRASMNSWAM